MIMLTFGRGRAFLDVCGRLWLYAGAFGCMWACLDVCGGPLGAFPRLYGLGRKDLYVLVADERYLLNNWNCSNQSGHNNLEVLNVRGPNFLSFYLCQGQYIC